MRNLQELLTATFMFMTAFLLVFYPEMVWAQASDAGSSPALESLSQISSYSVQVITAAAHFLIQFMPALWGTDLITGPDVINGIRPMWMFIRNFVNLVLVLVLLFIVFANLVTAGGEIKAGQLSEWTIKEKLPKLIFTLVAVNFTIMGIKILADGVYVATVALFSIGDQAIIARGTDSIEDMYSMKVDTKKFEQCKKGEGGANCKPVREIINQVYCPSGDPKKDPCLFKIRDSINVGSLLNPAKKNIMIAFGHHVMHLEMLPVVAANKNLLSVLDNAIFSLVMAVAYVLAMIASFIVLLVRVIMIWVFILLSPILLASIVMGVASEDLKKILTIVMKYMVVPMKIAAAFAFSFVMVSVVETISPSPTNFASTMEPGPALVPFWGKEGWGWIWKILTVVLFWKAIFEFALADIPGVSGVMGKISSLGQGMATSALRGAGEAAKIPGVGSLTGAFDSVSGAGDMLKNRNATSARRNRDRTFNTNTSESGEAITKALRRPMTLSSKTMNTFGQQMRKNGATTQNIDDADNASIREMMDKAKDLKIQNIPQTVSAFRKSIKRGMNSGGTAAASKIKTGLNAAGKNIANHINDKIDSSGSLKPRKTIDRSMLSNFAASTQANQNAIAQEIAKKQGDEKNWGSIAKSLRKMAAANP